MPTRWSDLLPELQERVAQHMPGNDVACSLRLLNKAAAELFRDATWVRLSEPVPPHAFVRRWGSPAAYHSLTLKDRQQLMALTAASGNLGNLQVAFAAVGCYPDASAIAGALAGKHHAICEWLEERVAYDWRCAAEAIARNGDIDQLRGVLNRWPDMRERAWRAAASAGRLDVCQALWAEGIFSACDWQMAAGAAAKSGHVDVAQWLLLHAPVDDKCFYAVVEQAAYGCDLQGLQRVYDTLLSVRQDVRRLMQGYRHNPLLGALTGPTPDWRAKVDWLRERGCALTDQAALSELEPSDTLQPDDRIERARLYLQLLPNGAQTRAAGTWQILHCGLKLAAPELVDFALEQWPQDRLADLGDWLPSGREEDIEDCINNMLNHPPHTPAHAVVAARLAARGVPIWRSVALKAASSGALHVLQWMAAGDEQAAAGDEGPAVAGAPMAELEGLAGAGPEVRAAAAAALREELEDLHMDGSLTAAESAAWNSYFETVKWMKKQHARINEDILSAAVESGNIALVEWTATEWMTAEGYPLPNDCACYWAALRNEDMAMLQCLRRLGVPWGFREQKLLGLAVGYGCQVEVLAWLLEQGCEVDWEEAKSAAAHRRGVTAAAVRAFIEQRACEQV